MLVAFVVGLALGALALRRSRRTPAPPAEPVLSPDAAAVLAALRASAVVLDAGDDVLRASPSAYSVGLVRSGRLGHAALADLVDAVRADGEIRDRELTLPRSRLAGSGVMIVQVRVAPLGDGRVLLVAEDHTAARRLDQVRRDFVANVSHELKTPVGALALLAETVHDAADDPVTVRRFAERMQHEARRLTRLVQEIIDLSRLQEPDALVDSELVDVDDVVAEAADRVRVEAESRQVTLVVGGERGLQVHGDRDLLATAVRNLLDNALRHSRPAGRVSVGVAARGEEVRIAVVDQGEGIPADQRNRIFERFYRGDPARARRTGGSGLGLSIVKHIAADHGGDITVWSVEGKGSTFTLVLPRATETTAPTDEEGPV